MMDTGQRMLDCCVRTLGYASILGLDLGFLEPEDLSWIGTLGHVVESRGPWESNSHAGFVLHSHFGTAYSIVSVSVGSASYIASR